MILNRTEMAGAMGISKPTLDNLIDEGCPYVTKGAKGIPWEFESSVVLEWYIKRNVAKRKNEVSSTDIYKLRKLRAETLLAEQKAEEAKREVATIKEIEKQFGEARKEIIKKLREVPKRAAPKLLGLTKEKEIKKEVLKVIDEVLMEIAGSTKNSS